PTKSFAWFNAHYKATIGPLLTGLPSDVELQAIIQQLFNVLWAPTADVRDLSRCRTCAVVGNSGRLKGSSHGLLIDAHNWVLRMNRAKITGFELDVESAVNLRPDVHLVLVPFKPLHLQWVTSAFRTGELTWCVIKQFIKADRNKVMALCYPVSAFLKYIHDNWIPASVSMFGFGVDSGGNWHHYWKKMRWSGALCRTRVRDTDVEFSFIERQAHECRTVFYKRWNIFLNCIKEELEGKNQTW
uniref:Uncharacterized protein n=1 Tax=Cyanoderma ruficeps TaxID=181631 RepID=A0A8C3RE36_9PASS